MQELGPTLFIVKEEFQEPLQTEGVNSDESHRASAGSSDNDDNVQTTKTKKQSSYR